MKRISQYLWVGSLALSLAACSASTTTSTDDTTDDTVAQITTIDELPKATSPVTEASSSISEKKNGILQLATTGMPLGGDSAPDFDSDSSMAACEMYNQTRQAVSNAAQGDLILCYIQSIFAAAEAGEEVVLDSDGNPVEIDIYDGQPHVFGLDFSGAEEEGGGEDSGGPDHIKFQITKNDSGVITAFTMYSCSGGTQEMYLNQTIDGTSFSMSDKGTYSDASESGTFSGSFSTEVTGTLDTNGRFVGEKPIVMSFTGQFSDDGSSTTDNWGSITFTQGAETADVEGYMSGTFTSNDTTSTFTNAIVGVMQLIDGNSDDADYNLSLLALGEGAVLGLSTGEMDGEAWEDYNYQEAWDGDTTASMEDPSTSEFWDDLTGVELSTATEPSITFGDGETYDCGDTEEATVVVANMTTSPDAACSNLSLSMDWIDCCTETGACGGGGGGEEGGGDVDISCTGDPDCVEFNGVDTVDGISTCNQDAGMCAITCAVDSDCDAASQVVGQPLTCNPIGNFCN